MRRNVCLTKTKILVALLQAWIMLTQGNKPMKITLRLQFTYLSLVSRDASPGEKKETRYCYPYKCLRQFFLGKCY